jgi:soluble lytic murein transglycosylase
MSSMHRKALVVALLAGSAAVAGTITGGALKVLPVALQASASVQPSYPQPYQAAPSPYGVPSRVSEAVAQWNALRQSDNLPFSSYSSFLLNHRGWPGESAMRKSAERAINLDSNAPSDIAAYFRTMPPLTATGWARYAFALQALGRTAEARDAARQAWYGGVLPQTDEQRLLESFAGTLTPADHDRRLDVLLANRDITSAMRILPYASAARRPLYEARLALQTKAPDAAAKLAMVAASAETDPGLLLDRANWLRDGAQEVAARSTLAQQRNYSTRPADPAKWMEGMLVFARSSADDRQWTTAYQIASQVEQAYPAGTDVSAKSLPERDNYTSLAWLGGSAALQKLNRPADALRMFELYARASQSPQTKTKGWYWAGRAAEAVGDQEKASGYYRQAA